MDGSFCVLTDRKTAKKEGKAVCIFKYTCFCMFMHKKPQKI